MQNKTYVFYFLYFLFLISHSRIGNENKNTFSIFWILLSNLEYNFLSNINQDHKLHSPHLHRPILIMNFPSP